MGFMHLRTSYSAIYIYILGRGFRRIYFNLDGTCEFFQNQLDILPKGRWYLIQYGQIIIVSRISSAIRDRANKRCQKVI